MSQNKLRFFFKLKESAQLIVHCWGNCVHNPCTIPIVHTFCSSLIPDVIKTFNLNKARGTNGIPVITLKELKKKYLSHYLLKLIYRLIQVIFQIV